MRRGFDGLAMMVQEVIKKDPYLCGGPGGCQLLEDPAGAMSSMMPTISSPLIRCSSIKTS
jgi:hypothetical protein